jgi:hypothetical protein
VDDLEAAALTGVDRILQHLERRRGRVDIRIQQRGDQRDAPVGGDEVLQAGLVVRERLVRDDRLRVRAQFGKQVGDERLEGRVVHGQGVGADDHLLEERVAAAEALDQVAGRL